MTAVSRFRFRIIILCYKFMTLPLHFIFPIFSLFSVVIFSFLVFIHLFIYILLRLALKLKGNCDQTVLIRIQLPRLFHTRLLFSQERVYFRTLQPVKIPRPISSACCLPFTSLPASSDAALTAPYSVVEPYPPLASVNGTACGKLRKIRRELLPLVRIHLIPSPQ